MLVCVPLQVHGIWKHASNPRWNLEKPGSFCTSPGKRKIKTKKKIYRQVKGDLRLAPFARMRAEGAAALHSLNF